MRGLPTIILVIASLLYAGAAAAQPRIPTPGGGGGGPSPGPSVGAGLVLKITAEQMAALLNEAGIRSEVRDIQGDKMVYAQFWGDALWSGVILDNCEKDGSGCRTLSFFANFGKDQPVDANWLNAWNSIYYMVRSYKLNDGSLLFKAHLLIFSGVTADYIKQSALFFKRVVDESSKFTGK